MRRRRWGPRIVFLLLAGTAGVSLYRMGLLDPGQVGPALTRLAEFAAALFPPRREVLSTLAGAMVETVEIAFVGTALGFALSVPLALLATTSLFGLTVSVVTRFVLGIVRTIPSLLWGVIFVIGFGLGPAAGALGVALYSAGFLGKLYYETFEGVDNEVMEAVRGAARSRLQLITYAVLPESANAILSQVLFMFEYNIRASTIMGFVGAGGIGFYILGYIQLLQYQNLLTALLLTLAVVMVVDYLSRRVRGLVLPPSS